MHFSKRESGSPREEVVAKFQAPQSLRRGPRRHHRCRLACMAALGLGLILVSIPLLLRWVPRNRLYGFRVPATLRHDAVWYEVNARSARHLLLLGAVMVVLEFAMPRPLRNEIITTLVVVGLAIETFVDWRYANRLARQLGV